MTTLFSGYILMKTDVGTMTTLFYEVGLMTTLPLVSPVWNNDNFSQVALMTTLMLEQ